MFINLLLRERYHHTESKALADHFLIENFNRRLDNEAVPKRKTCRKLAKKRSTKKVQIVAFHQLMLPPEYNEGWLKIILATCRKVRQVFRVCEKVLILGPMSCIIKRIRLFLMRTGLWEKQDLNQGL
jgi:hypothetical protein